MINNLMCIKIFLRLCFIFYFYLLFCCNLGFGFSFFGFFEDLFFCKCNNEIYFNNNIFIYIIFSMIMLDRKNVLFYNYENKK